MPAGAGAGNDQPVGRRIEPIQHRNVRLEAGLRPGFQDDRLDAERGQNVDIWWVEWRGQRNSIAAIEGGEERQREAAGRAHRHRHPFDRNGQAVPILVVRRDARPQRVAAKRLRIAERRARLQRGDGRGNGAGGAPLAGWPTSMRITCGAPGGSVAARALAAAMTSITRNGGAAAPLPTFSGISRRRHRAPARHRADR